MRTKLKSNLYTLVVVAIILFLLKSYYLSYENNVCLEFESVDEGLEYQIYYTENENEAFDDLKSVKLNTIKHADFVNNVVNLGNIKYLESLKIEVKSGDKKIKLRNLKITDGKKEKIILKDGLINTKIDDHYAKIITVKFTPKSTLRINYFVLANMFFAAYLFVFAIVLWTVKRKFSMKELTMYGFVMMFLILITLPSLHIDSNDIDTVENRVLNKPPTFEDIKNLEVKKIEDWYNDHFGFREKYIGVKDMIYNQKFFLYLF